MTIYNRSINVPDSGMNLSTDANSTSHDRISCVVSSAFNTYVIVGMYFIVFVLNMFGNSLVIFVIWYNKWKKSSTDIFILNLAIVDLLFAVTLPIWAIYRVRDWVPGITMCKIISMLQEVNFYSGILLLACISVDRYLAIVHAIEFLTKKKYWVKFLTIAIWIISFVLSSPIIWFRNPFPASEKSIACFGFLRENTRLWVIMRIVCRMMGFFIPLLIMLFCYGFAIKALLQSKNRQKRRAMKVLLAVVLVFLICWLPYNITIIADSLMRMIYVPELCLQQMHTALEVTQVLGITHSCINPILYASTGQKFRHSLLTMLASKGIISKDRLSS